MEWVCRLPNIWSRVFVEATTRELALRGTVGPQAESRFIRRVAETDGGMWRRKHAMGQEYLICKSRPFYCGRALRETGGTNYRLCSSVRPIFAIFGRQLSKGQSSDLHPGPLFSAPQIQKEILVDSTLSSGAIMRETYRRGSPWGAPKLYPRKYC